MLFTNEMRLVAFQVKKSGRKLRFMDPRDGWMYQISRRALMARDFCFVTQHEAVSANAHLQSQPA